MVKLKNVWLVSIFVATPFVQVYDLFDFFTKFDRFILFEKFIEKNKNSKPHLKYNIC